MTSKTERPPVNAVDRLICSRQVSYASRDTALQVSIRTSEKTGRATEVTPCRVCHGFHLSRKGEL